MNSNHKPDSHNRNVEPPEKPIVEALWADTLVFPYLARAKVISAQEHLFYLAAKEALGSDYVLCPKVALSALFMVDDPEADFLATDRLNRVYVDFAGCSATTMRVFFGIKLFDSSPGQPTKKEDVFVERVFEAARLPLLRYSLAGNYSVPDLKEQFTEAILIGEKHTEQNVEELHNDKTDAPPDFLPEIGVKEVVKAPVEPPIPPLPSLRKPEVCPTCGAALTVRKSIKGPNVGKDFYVCTRYPQCKTYLKVE